MTRLETLLEAVEETSAAAVDYRLAEDDVTRLQSRARCLATRDGWAVAGMQRALLDVACQHRADCDQNGCRTCASIRYGLASTLAGLRVLVDDERAAANPGPGCYAGPPEEDRRGRGAADLSRSGHERTVHRRRFGNLQEPLPMRGISSMS